MAHACNPSTQEAEAEGFCELEASLDYIRSHPEPIENSVSKSQKTKKTLLLTTPPLTLIQNLDLCLGARQKKQQGEPFPIGPGMHSIKDSKSPEYPTYPTGAPQL